MFPTLEHCKEMIIASFEFLQLVLVTDNQITTLKAAKPNRWANTVYWPNRCPFPIQNHLYSAPFINQDILWTHISWQNNESAVLPTRVHKRTYGLFEVDPVNVFKLRLVLRLDAVLLLKKSLHMEICKGFEILSCSSKYAVKRKECCIHALLAKTFAACDSLSSAGLVLMG